ncbi:uncharacterized protein LOC121429609 [Lytechinus variegatus]|uniref:uncharacterized protein LOC121429609 n=1 Tax=Lytechinus variegatus TaxID=7654 RepID=UPI001BB11BC1|nr:uncharacterized protein LOC121429609 [Lytechinus variegatus]
MIPRAAQAPTNRDEMVVAKTVLPRKGMVRLQAIGVSKSDSKSSDQKRGHRPAPQNHRKLQLKQKEAIRRVSNGTSEGAKEPTTLKHVLLELEETDVAPGRKPMQHGKGVHAKDANKKTPGALGQQTVSVAMKAAKRQFDTGELQGKMLTVFSHQ